jgi:hypothetical protein
VTFVIPPYDPTAQYLYVTYNYTTPGTPAIPATVGPPPTAYVPAVPQTWTDLIFLTYKQGSGNAGFDALFTASSDQGSFMPFIPMIVDKKFISDTYLPDAYAQVKKATRRALSTSYDKLAKTVADNPHSSDIDYAYIVFAVSLNVLENDCRNYIYQFFLKIMEGQSLSSTAFHDWQIAFAAAASSMTTWATWQVAQSNPLNPLYGTIAPVVIPYPQSPGYAIYINSDSRAIMNFGMNIKWDGINETTGSGQLTNPLGQPAKNNEFWFETVSNISVDAPVWVNAAVGTLPTTRAMTHVRLNWQVDSSHWRCLDIYNLTHSNSIYGGKEIIITAIDALADPKESGFLIPLNESIYKSMNLVISTQMATACCFMVFNQYTITTGPWWSSDAFKVIALVVGIAISVLTGGIGAIGLLGSNIAVGTMLGLTGTAAAVLGAVVNALAAIVLVQLIQVGSTALFGPQLGAIIGAIAGLIALQVGTGLANGTSMSDLLNSMLQPTNILKLTEAVGNGFAEVMQGNAAKIYQDQQDMIKSYDVASAKLEAQYQLEFGTGGGADLTINPLALLDVSLPNVKPNVVLVETPSTFLSRTLMTGGDICDLTFGSVSDFCSLNTSTTLPALT